MTTGAKFEGACGMADRGLGLKFGGLGGAEPGARLAQQGHARENPTFYFAMG
jgi:hypothetical protein